MVLPPLKWLRLSCTFMIPPQVTIIEANELLGSFDASLREYTARKLTKAVRPILFQQADVCFQTALLHRFENAPPSEALFHFIPLPCPTFLLAVRACGEGRW